MKDTGSISGRFRFKTKHLDTGEERISPWHHNLVVSGDGHGMNLFMRALMGDTTYPLAITKAKIGDDDTAATLADSDLGNVLIDDIEIANITLTSTTTLRVEFFLPNFLTPEDTYKEFGVFCGEQMLSRAVISPAFDKVGNIDTTVEYEYTIANL